MPVAPSAPSAPSAPVADDLAQALSTAVARLNRRLRRERDSDLTPNQIATLGTVERHGPMTPGAVAAVERVSPPSMTRTLNSLRELGLVDRQDDPDDGRQVLVRLSGEGRATLAAERGRRDAWLARQLQALPASERETLEAAVAVMAKVTVA